VVSGRIADRRSTKRPLVLLGYGLSSAVRPLIALASSWTQVFAIRVSDRIGKGVRGAPRDAMLAVWADRTNRGRIFGFHRAMDHLGAVIGPIGATLFLLAAPGRYRTLFALTIIPGAIAVLLILLVPEGDDASSRREAAPAGDGAPLPRRFYWFIGVLGLFALGNSSDAFLLLKLTDASGSGQFVPLMWAALHVVKAAVSVVGGSWSDRVGRRAVIAAGWITYAVVYAGFAMSSHLASLLAWFMLYGCYFGFAEGTERALVADLAPASSRGTAFGIYNAVGGIGALLASLVFGEIWSHRGASAAFGLGAALALAATLLLFLVVPRSTSYNRASA